jgi:hypothetical protein
MTNRVKNAPNGNTNKDEFANTKYGKDVIEITDKLS